RRRHTSLQGDWSSDVCSSDLNSSGALSSRTAVNDVIRGLGSLDLQKLWKVHPLNVDYTGGVVWFQGKGGGQTYQLHSLAAIQRRSEERRVGKECRARKEVR